jgi:PAS domain S-box-containing protein
MTEKDEDDRLRSVATQNASAIQAARQRAERELAAERERLRITLASIGDAVISTDVDGRVTFLNGVAEALTGWTQAEAVGRPLPEVFRIVNAHSRRPVGNPALRALREGVVVGLANHTVLVARDGTERPIDDSAAPIRDGSGAVVGAVLVFRDVTERFRAQEARARLAAIVDSSDDAIVSKTLDGVITSWNAGAERLFGHTAAEAVGQLITLVIPPERIGEEGVILEKLARGERVDHFETVRVTKGGRRIDISLTISPIRDEEGRVIGASKIARDITPRVRAEQELRRGEERLRAALAEASQAAAANAKFRAFFDQGTHFAAVLALDGTVVEANRFCLDTCRFRRDEVIGTPFWECGWWSRSPALAAAVREAFREATEGRAVRTETAYHVASGAERTLDLVLAPVTDAAGRALFVAATGTDITERRRMEDELRDTDRKKDDFIALLAHELRNPLAPVRNGLQALQLAGGQPPALEKTHAMMERQLGHMVRLLDDLLDVSRITRNKMELRKEVLPLADVVASAVETARPAVEAGGHELTVALPPEPVYVEADLTRLAQVFSNLLTNSAKYTDRGGRIWLTAERRGGEVVVAVRDTGIGIPAESLPKIFDMFSQVDRSIERTTGGLGIGLALVKGLTEMHGGTVTAASGGPGRGSEFTVRIPALAGEPAARRPADAEPAVPSFPPRRILVVDDNRDSGESMAELLQLLGNEVALAYDGVEAVERAADFRPEVILMDIGMPRLNGLDATHRIREQPWGRSVVIVALTGYGQVSDRTQSKAAGCDGHLVKPVTLADLQKLLADLDAGDPG